MAYLELYVSFHIQNPAKLIILEYLEPKIYSELCQGIFWYKLCNVRILTALSYS